MRSLSEAMFGLELPILLDKGVDTVNHFLHELDLAVAEPVLVGNVVSDAGLTARLTTGASGLEMKLFTSIGQSLGALLGVAGQVDVHASTHASAQVGGAGMDEAVLGVQHKVLTRLFLHRVSHCLNASGKTVENCSDVTARLHGDDPELVLLVDPGEEGFVLVMEDSATLWPISLHARNLQVLVPGHEEEMIIDQLLPDLLLHACQREVGASKITSQVSKCLLHQVLNAKALVLGDSRGQAEPVDVATNTDAGGVDRGGGVDGAFDFGRIHVAGVCGVGSDAMVLLDQRVEHV